jgi:hypothetical protein
LSNASPKEELQQTMSHHKRGIHVAPIAALLAKMDEGLQQKTDEPPNYNFTFFPQHLTN